jgi:nitrogen fixation-related uncharacterized protein
MVGSVAMPEPYMLIPLAVVALAVVLLALALLLPPTER